jgi:Cdc6-like AAA superfamily ATPase
LFFFNDSKAQKQQRNDTYCTDRHADTIPLRMDYFEQQLALLAQERAADLAAYRMLTESTSVATRRANGLSWYPIAIRGTEMGKGDYLAVEAERTTHHDIQHQLRFGVAAALFSQHDPQHYRLEGTISFQSGNRLKITLRTDELPEWASEGKLGIDLLFDDNSYDEMESALKLAAKLQQEPGKNRLIRVLTGATAAAFANTDPKVQLPGLNASQNAAAAKILSAQDLAIVHGPPGTGKTTTLVQAIKALIRQEPQQVLVVAPSNTAVDLMSERLAAAGLNVLRIGNPARVSEHLMALTLDSRMAAHGQTKEIKRLKKQANEFRDMAHKYKRNFGKAEREQRKALFDEAHRIMKDVANTEQYIIDDLVAKADVIAATLVGANHYTIQRRRYKTVVIDEAGQALEPACWIPILKAEKVVLAGDHLQLPPTIKSEGAARAGFADTLLEKSVRLHPEAVVLLEEQYRMHQSIMGYPSRVFYGDRLKAHDSVATHTLFPGDDPLLFIDTAGCGFEEQAEGTSVTNPEEAAFLLEHLQQLTEQLQAYYSPEQFPTIAVIAPYKRQVELLKELVQHNPALLALQKKLAVNTIDGFQGQERDIVYISMTRSNPDGTIGFLNDIRRMNVAMTRARKKLVVTGDSGTLAQLAFYTDFIGYTESCHAYKSAWEFRNI